MRVLVADGLESEAIAKLRAVHHVDVVEADPKQLLEIIPNYDALIVRSRTKVSAEVLGLLGSGRIGAEVARRAQAFGMDVIAFDPYLPPPAAKERGIRLVDSLAALLMQVDYLSIHAALTPETKGMIGAKELALMKRTAYLVNCARGEIVQEAALADALTSGTLAGAALDVLEKEPPTGSPILVAPNTVFTPPLGASTHDAPARAGGIIADQVLKVLRGEKPDFAVNPDVYA